MPTLTIGRMATLYGLHRSTLYEAVDKGRVTAQVNGKGQKILDLSEMIRVYGEPPGQTTLTQQNPTPSANDNPTPTTERLLAELVELTRHQGEELRRLREEVASLRRLPPPSEQSNESPDNTRSSLYDQPKADDGFLQERPNVVADNRKGSDASDDPHGLRSLARSLYQNAPSD